VGERRTVLKDSSQTREKVQVAVQTKNSVAWLDAIIPFNIAFGPVATLIQLLILNFNGTVIDVALAITLFNAVSIPAAVMWGFVADRYQRRKIIIVASYLSSALILVSFLFVGTGYWVSLLYGAFSFVTAASTTPLNLLVMETEQKQKWATAFARFSMVTSIGQTVGLMLSVGWGLFFPLTYLVVPLAILSIVSAVLAVVMIKEPNVVFERQVIVMSKSSFFQRILAVPVFFLRVPRLNDFRRVFRDLKCELTRNVPVLYFSIFMFYLASGIFNTSFVPSLEANNVSGFLIFLVTTVAMVVQVVSFRYAGPFTEKRSPVKASVGGLVLRSLGYGFLGVSVYVFSGVLFLAPVLILYPLAAGFAYSVYYTASNTMVFNTLHVGRQGSSLGVYSALVGIATMLGSFVSGFTSFFLGYSLTFILAAVFLAVSAWLGSLLGREKRRED
jgi:MFS family permease